MRLELKPEERLIQFKAEPVNDQGNDNKSSHSQAREQILKLQWSRPDNGQRSHRRKKLKRERGIKPVRGVFAPV